MDRSVSSDTLLPGEASVKIAFVSQARDAISASGIQSGSVAIVTWELARRLAARHDVVIYAPLQGDQPLEEQAFGVRIRRIPGVRRNFHRARDLLGGMLGAHPPHFVRASYFQEYAREIAKWLRKDPPDCVHVQVASQFMPLFRSAAPNAQIVLHTHDELLTRAGRNLVGSRISRADAIVTCSDYITSRWQATFEPFASRVFTVRNGVDLQRFNAPAVGERAGANASLPREVLFVGRISPEKGAHVLAEAFETVSAELPGTRLTFVGPTGLLPYSYLRLLSDDKKVASLREFYGDGFVEQMRRQVFGAKHGYIDMFMAKLSARAAADVAFVGPVSFDRIADFYRRATVLAAPSMLPEPFGLPLAEALACGLPVVASRAGGMREIVSDGLDGHLIERGDVAGLAAALIHVLTDDTDRLRMRAFAAAKAEGQFGWDHSVQMLESIYAGTAIVRSSCAIVEA
jgi:glycosyltransferase involved in cell wall biosynthesis